MLRYSLEKGHNASSHCQFDTIRKIRTLSTNMYESSSTQGASALSMRAGANCLNLSSCPTDSVFFRAFLRGCEKRMGGITIQDTALSIPLLFNILNRYELEFENPLSTLARKRDIVMIASYLVMGFCDGLRGNEPFLMEATAVCEYAEKGRNHKDSFVCLPLMGRFKNEVGERNVMRFLVGTTASGIPIRKEFVCLPLMGRFKNEVGERNVMRFLVGTTGSGIPIRKWIDRLVAVLRSEGKDKGGLGPAFCSPSGYVLSYRKMDWEFHKALQQVQEEHPELIATGLEVGELYHINRSLRRGVTSRATELCLSQTIIDTNNRWKII